MIRFVPWSEVGTITVSPGDNVVEVGAFELAEGADTLWVRMTNTGAPGPWPWSYGILSFKTDEGQPLGSIKAYNSFDGEVFRLGVGLTPSVRAGLLTFEPRGFNMAWIKQGNPWSLKFEAQSGDSQMTEQYWSRIPGTLAPSNEGDDVNLDSGDLFCANITVGESDIRLTDARRIIVGDSASSSSTTRSGIDLRAEKEYENARLVVQGTSASGLNAAGYSLYRGADLVWIMRYSGTSTFRGTVDAPDFNLVSGDSSFYRSTADGVEYSGPSLSLIEEITRLEGLVKELYERLRMVPEGGWPVWDGNPDLLQSLGRSNTSQH